MNIGMRANARRPEPARLAAMWFGIQLVWGAILGISLQARCTELAAAHASLAAYGEISFAGALAAAIVQLAVGPWSDRLRVRGGSRARFYAVGALGGAAAVLAFYGAQTLGELAAAFVLLQVALNIAIGPYQAILPDAMPDDRLGVASGWMAAMQSAGNAVGAILASIVGGVTLGAAIAFALLVCAAVTIAHVRSTPLARIVPDRFVPTRPLVDLFISRAAFYAGLYTILGYLFFYVRDLLGPRAPLPATTASGVCILLFTVAGALGAALGARPADRFDERAVVAAGGVMVAAAALALASLHALAFVALAVIVAGAGWGVFLCADWAYACRLLPKSSLATTMALWNLAIVIPQMLAPLIVTVLLARTGVLAASSVAPRIAMLAAAAEILIGTLWIRRLPARNDGK